MKHEDNQKVTQRVFQVVKLLYMVLQWQIHVMIYLSKSIMCATLRVNPNVNYDLE